MPSRWIGGLDEAGRGSWIGPMVLGAFRLPREELGRLVELGVRDSKLLTPGRRTRLAADLARCGEIRTRSVPPKVIDRWVRHHGLNELEIREFLRLIRGWDDTEIIADACDVDAERFAARLRAGAGPGVAISALHRADRIFPVVGAASIVAKVRRDRSVARILAGLGTGPASGYPSDPKTEAVVRAGLRPGEPWPPWLRASWKTTERVLGPRARTTLDDFFR
ncbi:MAG: ribonuclease HII [Thermoplasmata archaeon]